jgi:hypothetical protein
MLSGKGGIIGRALGSRLTELGSEYAGVATCYQNSGSTYLTYGSNAVNVLPSNYTFTQLLFHHFYRYSNEDIIRELQNIRTTSGIYGCSAEDQYTLVEVYLGSIKYLSGVDITVCYYGVT